MNSSSLLDVVMAYSRQIPFLELEHEADVGLEVYGADLPELFKNAAQGLFCLITDLEKVAMGMTRHISIDETDELLVVFLNELLYLWDTERFIPLNLSITMEGGKLEADVEGATFDPDKHPVHREVKAVTYHKFAIQQENNLLKATVFLDI